MAFCSVSTRTERSMPLSFATWSRTMFRLTIGACGAGEAILFSLLDSVVGRLEHGLDVGLAHLRPRDPEDLAVHVDHHGTVLVTFQYSYKSLAVLALRKRPERLHPNLAPGELLEVLRRPERPVKARARDLQVVRPLDGVLDVQRRRESPGDRRAVFQRDPAGPVDVKPERLASAAAAQLDVDQLQPFLRRERRGELPHLLEDLFLPAHSPMLRPAASAPAPKNEKVGHPGPTFGSCSENVRPEVTPRPVIVKQRRRRPCSSLRQCRCGPETTGRPTRPAPWRSSGRRPTGAPRSSVSPRCGSISAPPGRSMPSPGPSTAPSWRGSASSLPNAASGAWRDRSPSWQWRRRPEAGPVEAAACTTPAR